jgi:hypothetical protein
MPFKRLTIQLTEEQHNAFKADMREVLADLIQMSIDAS